MAMKTPEKQILPIAPAYPDLNALTKWAGDLTRTLQQNLATIARKANDENVFTPVADFNMHGFSIINALNGTFSGTLTAAVGTFSGALSAASASFTGAISGSQITLSGLTASQAVQTDGSKKLISLANTGTGSNVLATSPTLVTPTLGVASATSLALAGALTGATTGSFSGLLSANAGINVNGNAQALMVGNTTNSDQVLELGYTGGTARVVAIDFHTSATAQDYNVRLLASGNVGAGAGLLNISATGGVTFDGPLTNSLNPVTGPAFNVAGNSQNITSGSEISLSANSGLLVLNENTSTGATAIYLCGGGVVTKIGGDASFVVSSTPTTSQIGVYYDGAATRYKVKNGFASTKNLGILWIATRNSV